MRIKVVSGGANTGTKVYLIYGDTVRDISDCVSAAEWVHDCNDLATPQLVLRVARPIVDLGIDVGEIVVRQPRPVGCTTSPLGKPGNNGPVS